jgi:transposase
MARPKRVHRYSLEFKLTAVKLSRLSGVHVQDVAEALDIHPFMLSRWRKESRDGRLRGSVRKVELSRRVDVKRSNIGLQRTQGSCAPLGR